MTAVRSTPNMADTGAIARDEIFDIVRDRLADILEIEPDGDHRGSVVRRRPRRRLARPDRAGRGARGGAERAHGRLPHRRRGPRRPEDGPRRGRLRPRPRGQRRLIALDVTAVRRRGRTSGPGRGDAGGDGDVMALVRRLGYRFVDEALIDRAMAHRSWCSENPGHASNERLEFLGDAVLGWVIADLAFRTFPDMTEGELTGLRKGVVNATTLAEFATELGLGPPHQAGQGRGGDGRAGQGVDPVRRPGGGDRRRLRRRRSGHGLRVRRRLIDRAPARHVGAPRTSSTSSRRCRSWSSAAGLPAPVYDISEEGPDHDKRFHATVLVDGEVRGSGSGRSKRVAEQAAAAEAARAFPPDA